MDNLIWHFNIDLETFSISDKNNNDMRSVLLIVYDGDEKQAHAIPIPANIALNLGAEISRLAYNALKEEQ